MSCKTRRTAEPPKTPVQRRLDSPALPGAATAKRRAEPAPPDPLARKKKTGFTLTKRLTARANLNREAAKPSRRPPKVTVGREATRPRPRKVNCNTPEVAA